MSETSSQETPASPAQPAASNTTQVAEPLRRFVACLNAPITIFALSTVAISLVGSMFSNMNHCQVEARSAIDLSEKLETELNARGRALSLKLIDADNISELEIAFNNVDKRSIFYDFRDRSYEDLFNQYYNIKPRINGFDDSGLMNGKLYFHIQNFLEHNSSRNDPIFHQWKSNELLDRHGSSYGPGYEGLIAQRSPRYQPDCGPGISFWHTLFGYQLYLATLVPPPAVPTTH